MRKFEKDAKLYIHETTTLRSGTIDSFVEGFDHHYKPLMQELDSKLFGIWEGNSFNSNWTEVTTIWEIDSWSHFGKVARAQHRDAVFTPRFRDWKVHLGSIDATGEGRVMNPGRSTRTVEKLALDGVRAPVVIQEIMTTKPGKQDAYIEQLERHYVPWSEKTGKLWLGSFQTHLRYDEVIHYWVLEDGWDTFENHFPAWKEDPPADIVSWMALAPALRDGWDDSILQSLPPSPLG